jgi:S1-C subfamily serine protease
MEAQILLAGEAKARIVPDASDYSHERSLVLLTLYQKDGLWRVLVAGEGFYDGIIGLQRFLSLPQVVLERIKPPVPPAAALAAAGAGAAAAVASDQPLSAVLAQPLLLPQQWPGAVAPRLPAGLTPAVAFIVVEQKDGSSATGTGFFVTPGGHLLTCYHVIEDCQQVSVRAEGEKEFRAAVVLAGSEEHDLALLWLPDGCGSVHWLPLATDGNPQLGDELGLLAYPLGGSLGGGITYSQGIINGLRQQEGIPFLQIDTGAAPGSSGGPIFRRDDGRVIGLLHGGIRSSGHNMTINLGVDIRNLIALAWLRP